MPRSPSRLAWGMAACAACMACALVLERALGLHPMDRPVAVASASRPIEVETPPPERRRAPPSPAELRGSALAIDAARPASYRVPGARSSNVAKAFQSSTWGERRLRALAEVLEARSSATVRARVVDEMARLVVRHRSGIGDELASLLRARVAELDDPRLAYALGRSMAP